MGLDILRLTRRENYRDIHDHEKASELWRDGIGGVLGTLATAGVALSMDFAQSQELAGVENGFGAAAIGFAAYTGYKLSKLDELRHTALKPNSGE